MTDVKFWNSKAFSKQIWGLTLALLAFAFVMVGAAQAADGTDKPGGPDQFLQMFGDQAIAVLGDTGLDEPARQAALRRLLHAGFDMDRIAKLTLGRHWRSTTAHDRQAYRQAFEHYVVDTYDRRLRAYAGQRLAVRGWTPVKDDALVHSEILGEGAPIAIDWRLGQTTDGWRIVDVVVEGVSMLVTQRNEFASIVERRGGVRALVEHLNGSVRTARAS